MLDAAGYAKTEIDIVKNGNAVQIELPEDAMYVILENITSAKDQNLKKTGMNIFPNPSNGSFSIEIPHFSNQNYAVEIRNVLGQKVWEQNGIQQKKLEVKLGKNYSGLLVVALKQDNAVIESGKIQIN
jgi:hypothetical protein